MNPLGTHSFSRNRMNGIKSVAICTALLLAIPGYSKAAGFDLTNWTVEQYRLSGQPGAMWPLSDGNMVATQTLNAEPSMLLSDFTIDHATHPGIAGSWRVDTLVDDDIFGIVFGYQNRGQYYLYDWKQADQSSGQIVADGGMHLRKIDVLGGGDPIFLDLAGGTDTDNMQIFEQNDLAWAALTDYGFLLTFASTGFELSITEGDVLLANFVVNDTMFTAGQFGFFNNSQPAVRYNAGVVPLPAAVWLFASGLGLLGWQGRRRAVASRGPCCHR